MRFSQSGFLTARTQERIKKEYCTAKAAANGDEGTDDEDERKPSGTSKRMLKMLEKNDKSRQYDDEQEEVEKEPDPSQTYAGPVIQAQPPWPGSQQPTITSSNGTNQPNTQVKRPLPGAPGSRPTSPVPSQSKHSLVAKQATSPKVPQDQPTLVLWRRHL